LQANKAANKAIIMNKFGDLGLMLATAYLFIHFKTVDFNTLNGLAYVVTSEFGVGFETTRSFQNDYICAHLPRWFDYVAFLLLLAVCGKSAQFGLHTWLPSAIEGPTPVSALIHAATIVTAGIFLLFRLSFFFELSETARIVAIYIGLCTSILAGLTALTSFDLKKIIAYSTCSQLGYIVVACGFSAYNLAFFHLLNHAFFKAALFLTAGLIIHFFNGEQDLRLLYVGQTSFLIISVFFLASVALIGLPFLAGYYSKEGIVFSAVKINQNTVLWLSVLSALLTIGYSLRTFYYLFLRVGVKPQRVIRYYPNTKIIIYPIVCLVFFSIFFGYFGREVYLGPAAVVLLWPLFIQPLGRKLIFIPNYAQYNLAYADNQIKIALHINNAQIYYYTPYGLMDNALLTSLGHHDYQNIKTLGSVNRMFLQNSTLPSGILDYSAYNDIDTCREVPRFPF
jgi:NADH-ubiquinone oxidoreductase chain 5